MQYDFTFRSRRSNVLAKNGMVASSHRLASLAGLDVLRAGGSAADAAVAIAAMLNVVEPFSTGVGGDCFALYWDAATQSVYALNGSGRSAQNANLQKLQDAGYDKFPLFTGQAVTVPGTVGAWSALVDRFGKKSLAENLAPAIDTAFTGFAVTEWISSGWSLMVNRILRQNDDKSLPKHLQYGEKYQPSGNEFLIDGRAPQFGEWMTLPTLGETLANIAEKGKDYFYKGEFASRLCDHVQTYGGWLESSDLEDYLPEWVKPIYADYHGVRLYECPPNGQGFAAIIAAKIANGFDLAGMDYVQRTHTLIECMRLGFLEALNWVSDPHFNEIPFDRLFSEGYAQNQRNAIHPDQAIKHLPINYDATGDDTVYVTVVDGEGNACSLINSLYMGGGTGLVVPGTGVFLQNRGANFSLNPNHLNALEGGKRPYHTIIPGMITKDNQLFASYGVMGGFMQPQGHLQVLSNLVDLELTPQQALDMPRFCLDVNNGGGVGALDPGGEVLIEDGFSFTDMAVLRHKGHRVSPISGRERVVFGGGQVILRDPKTGILMGGSDPRKDGCALGW